MKNLRDIFEAQARLLAWHILEEVKRAPLAELVAPDLVHVSRLRVLDAAPRVPTGRRRRTRAQLDAELGMVVEALKVAPGGMRSEELQVELGISRDRLPRVLKYGLRTARRLVKRGARRATVYQLRRY